MELYMEYNIMFHIIVTKFQSKFEHEIWLSEWGSNPSFMWQILMTINTIMVVSLSAH